MTEQQNPLLSQGSNLPAPTADWRERVEENLQRVCIGSLILATILLFYDLYAASQSNQWVLAILGLVVFLLMLIATFARKLSFSFRSSLLMAGFSGTGIISGLLQGNMMAGMLFLMAGIMITALFFKRQQWWWSFAANAMLAVVVTIAQVAQWAPVFGVTLPSSPLLSAAGSLAVILFITYLLSMGALNSSSQLTQMLVKEQQDIAALTGSNEDLKKANANLEEQLDQKELRSLIVKQIVNEAAQQQDLEGALKAAANAMNAHFGQYHTGIFLTDEKSEYAVFKAGSSEASKEMLSRQHRLRLKEEGLVGNVISNGVQEIIADVNETPVHFKNPSLPLTRSEMAVPLRFGTEIIGALDVQSQNVGQFNQEDVLLLQEMADGLAPLIDKLRQIEAIHHEIEELKGREQEATVRRWQASLRSARRNLHFRFSGSEAAPVTDDGSVTQSVSSVSSMVINPLPAEEAVSPTGSGSMITVPIKFRDQILGVVNLKVGDQKVSEEFVSLIDSATDRLALALENARLLEDIQQRADREHRVANISDRVRAATDIDEILKTAAEEIGKSLGVGEVRIQLKTTSTR